MLSGFYKSSHYISSYFQNLHSLVTVAGHGPAAGVDSDHLSMNLSYTFSVFFAETNRQLMQWSREFNHLPQI